MNMHAASMEFSLLHPKTLELLNKIRNSKGSLSAEHVIALLDDAIKQGREKFLLSMQEVLAPKKVAPSRPQRTVEPFVAEIENFRLLSNLPVPSFVSEIFAASALSAINVGKKTKTMSLAALVKRFREKATEEQLRAMAREVVNKNTRTH